MRLENLKVGDRVTLVRHSYSRKVPNEFRIVAKVLKNAIIDDTGKKWTMSGYAWCSGDTAWAKDWLRPYESDDEEYNAIAVHENAMENMRRRLACPSAWRDVDMPGLRAACAILDEAVAAAEAKAKGGGDGEA